MQQYTNTCTLFLSLFHTHACACAYTILCTRSRCNTQWYTHTLHVHALSMHTHRVHAYTINGEHTPCTSAHSQRCTHTLHDIFNVRTFSMVHTYLTQHIIVRTHFRRNTQWCTHTLHMHTHTTVHAHPTQHTFAHSHSRCNTQSYIHTPHVHTHNCKYTPYQTHS